jgi:hypothetical protein
MLGLNPDCRGASSPMCRVFLAAIAALAGVSGAIVSSIDHANWMRDLMPIIGNATLLDLSLPGSHDTLTYDTSVTVADDAELIPPRLATILHSLGDFLGFNSAMRPMVCALLTTALLKACQLRSCYFCHHAALLSVECLHSA